jgi:hypothetical protein
LRDAVNEIARAAPGLVKGIAGALAGLIPLALVPDWLEDGVSEDEIGHYLFRSWLTAILGALIAVFIYNWIVKRAWDSWDASEKYRQPEPRVPPPSEARNDGERLGFMPKRGALRLLNRLSLSGVWAPRQGDGGAVAGGPSPGGQ